MIKKSQIAASWRRTLIMFAFVQVVGLFVFAFDLHASAKGEIGQSTSTLVFVYVGFLAFSGVLLWLMSLIRKFIGTRGTDG